ncbi:MAG: FHA domain-containing protein, partial [Kiritimatiellae bacterium]|nr:FHA domain-containing protein [Kiritimatiellia bacterium]
AEVSGCADIKVEYNIARVFVEGLIFPFDFRITPLVSGVEDVRIEIETGGAETVRESPPEVWEPNVTVDVPLRFRAPEGCRGIVPFRVYIGWRRGGTRHWGTFTARHRVFRRRDRVGPALNTLYLDVSQKINVADTKASDPQIHVQVESLKGALDALQTRADDPASDLEHVDLPAVWQTVVLRKCRRGVPLTKEAPPREARVARLTLERKGVLLHLLSGSEVQLGRNRECDIVTRVFAADGTCSEQGQWISKFHCRIALQGGTVRLINEGRNPMTGEVKAPDNGTLLDGKEVPPGTSTDLPTGRGFTLGLARRGFGAAPVLTLQGRVWMAAEFPFEPDDCGAEPDSKAPACLVLRRTDEVPESFVVLWQRCLARFFAPEFGDLCLCRREDAFALRSASSCDWLVAGDGATDSRRGVVVRPYSQWGL